MLHLCFWCVWCIRVVFWRWWDKQHASSVFHMSVLWTVWSDQRWSTQSHWWRACRQHTWSGEWTTEYCLGLTVTVSLILLQNPGDLLEYLHTCNSWLYITHALIQQCCTMRVWSEYFLETLGNLLNHNCWSVRQSDCTLKCSTVDNWHSTVFHCCGLFACLLVIWPVKPIPEATYSVSSEVSSLYSFF